MDVDVKKFLKIKFCFFFCYLKTCLIENQNLQRNHERCKTKPTDHPPPPLPPLVTHWKPYDSPKSSSSDSPSSQNKFQNFMHLESERHMFLQSINGPQLHKKNSHRNLCILHGNTSEIKVTTVKISEHINLFKIIRWTQIPSNFRQYLIYISLLKNIYKLVSLPFASDKNLKELQQVINVK